jgi:hypothetical protein
MVCKQFGKCWRTRLRQTPVFPRRRESRWDSGFRRSAGFSRSGARGDGSAGDER